MLHDGSGCSNLMTVKIKLTSQFSYVGKIFNLCSY